MKTLFGIICGVSVGFMSGGFLSGATVLSSDALIILAVAAGFGTVYTIHKM